MPVFHFMPTYLVNSVGLGSALASYMAGFLYLGAVLINLIAGKLTETWGPYVLIVISSLFVAVFLILSTYFHTLWMLPILLHFLGIGISAGIPAQNLILSSLSPKGRKGTAFGTLMGIGTLANALSPLLVGVIADAVGLDLTFRLAAIPTVLSCLLIYALTKTSAVRKTLLHPTRRL